MELCASGTWARANFDRQIAAIETLFGWAETQKPEARSESPKSPKRSIILEDDEP